MKDIYAFDSLRFQYLRDDHFPEIIKMLSKESVCKHVFFGPNSEADTREYFSPLCESIQSNLSDNKMPNEHVFTIFENGIFIGQCALIPVMFTSGNYIIGYQIDDVHWGKSLGTKACKFLIDYAFNILNAQRLTGDCFADNIGSKRIMESCGFRQEGCQKKYYLKDGVYHDNLLYALFREEYMNGEWSSVNSE